MSLPWCCPLSSSVSAEDKAWLDVHVDSIAWEALTVSVAARNGDGRPAVLRMYPLRYDPKGRGSKEPIPWVNLYFLVCPKLITAVGKLETSGLIDVFDEQIETDPALAKRLADDHRAYAAERWSLLTAEDQEYATMKHYDSTLRDSGICGMKYWKRVKCLHAHYAFYLANGRSSLVGSWVEEKLVQMKDAEAAALCTT